MIENLTPEKIKLTAFSHGAGCGCKISPSVLSEILKGNETADTFPELLVGNSSRDDAAVLDIGNGQALISTTDFFMPIVDDPYEFGRIAATNAISDVYAMGGKPVLAIAILGWPVDKLPAEVASKVIAGGKAVCAEAGIPLGGGHSIDSPEPIFGLAVNGIVSDQQLKQNNTANEGDLIFLTKKLGIGILTTASKKSMLTENDLQLAIDSMTRLNSIGEQLGTLPYVTALTDVTGFGLAGHLLEMAEGSGLSIEINFSSVPVLDPVTGYIQKGCVPGGTTRNWKSYGGKISGVSEQTKTIIADPQTSGGLLVAVRPDHHESFSEFMKQNNQPDYSFQPIGKFTSGGDPVLNVIE